MAGDAVAREGSQRVSLDNAFHAGDFFVPPSAHEPLCDSISLRSESSADVDHEAGLQAFCSLVTEP